MSRNTNFEKLWNVSVTKGTEDYSDITAGVPGKGMGKPFKQYN
jgi:hypothetical protein